MLYFEIQWSGRVYHGKARVQNGNTTLPVRVRCSVRIFWVSPGYHNDNADYKTQEHHNVIHGDPVKSQHNVTQGTEKTINL